MSMYALGCSVGGRWSTINEYTTHRFVSVVIDAILPTKVWVNALGLESHSGKINVLRVFCVRAGLVEKRVISWCEILRICICGSGEWCHIPTKVWVSALGVEAHSGKLNVLRGFCLLRSARSVSRWSTVNNVRHRFVCQRWRMPLSQPKCSWML